MPVIEFKEITKIYKMGDVQVHALKSISFSIEHGDYVIIMGPSGSGKSTLLQILGCLDRPSSGEVFIDGTQTSKMNEDQLAKVRNRKIGFVF
ncbi:MAG TPA: ATP-binding cassette domain-containing protein, partial [Petrotogaceae bacterium]|nr:ATP-binding cassette domain-containing protein [Petrotogaceae bacterium]